MAVAEAVSSEALFGDVHPQSSRRLLLASLDCFATHGYTATTTRQIAALTDMSPAAVYVHYRSKQELLGALSRAGHSAVLRHVERAVHGLQAPTDRVRRFVEAFADWHATHQKLARVIQYELGGLSAKQLDDVRCDRDRVEAILRGAIRDGVTAGTIRADDVDGAALALLSLGIDVARWYSPEGRKTPQEIGAFYGQLAMRALAQ